MHAEGALDKFAWYRYRLSESAATLIHADWLCRSENLGLVDAPEPFHRMVAGPPTVVPLGRLPPVRLGQPFGQPLSRKTPKRLKNDPSRIAASGAGLLKVLKGLWCRGTESNCRHQPFQGCALPTELPRHGRDGTDSGGSKRAARLYSRSALPNGPHLTKMTRFSSTLFPPQPIQA